MGNLARFIHFYTDPDENPVPTDSLNTLTGSVVKFNCSGAFPVVNLTANIKSVQSGTGDPSPDNVRPISGWTGVNVYRTGADEPSEAEPTISISFPDAAGTVYDGTLDVTTGVLTVTHTAVDLGDLSWSRDTTTLSYPVFRSGNIPKVSAPIGATNLLCTCFKVVATRTQLTSQYTIAPWNVTTAAYVGVRNDDYTDADAFKESVTGQMLRYKFKNPVTYQLTPQTVKTLVGINNIWVDTGNVSVTAYGEPVLDSQANTLLGAGLSNNAVNEPESDEEYSEI